MGWLLIINLVALVLLGLWRFGKIGRQPLELTAAALLVGLAGYAFFGSPNKPGSPKQSAADIGGATAAIPTSVTDTANLTDFLRSIDQLVQSGQTRDAADRINARIAKDPQNADLWVALGQALFAHSNGNMSASAETAFQRAAEIAPNHPGPPFFLGYAQVQAGKYDEAAAIWRALLARAQPDSPWKPDLEARLAEITPMLTPAPKDGAKPAPAASQ
jgi:tetratricopeptide (TPR) repeat protein